MYYRHNLNFNYPDKCDEHMITVKHLRDTQFDTEYPYLNKKLWFKLIRGAYWVLVTFIMFPVLKIMYGLRIRGRKNIKKNKELLSNGVITISNHVFFLDYLCVLKAIRPHLPFFPAWKTNFEGPNQKFIRMSGGIPIPTHSAHAMLKFNGAIEEVLEKKRWLHFFPEGSMWLYYPDIRPIKRAVFDYAVKYDRPVLPLTFSFRPRKGITRLFTKKPWVDLQIGEPMLPNTELPRRVAATEMQENAYHTMQVMAGIDADHPNHNDDLNLEHYQKTM